MVHCGIIEIDYSVHCKHIAPFFSKDCQDFPDKCDTCGNNNIKEWMQKNPVPSPTSFYIPFKHE